MLAKKNKVTLSAAGTGQCQARDRNLIAVLPRLAATRTQEPRCIAHAGQQQKKKGKLLTKMLLKGEGDLGAVPDTLHAPYIHLYVMLPSGVYNLWATFGMCSEQQCKRDDAGAGLFWLSEKEELLHCSRPYLWRSVSPTGSLTA